jgi:hypothetical protein
MFVKITERFYQLDNVFSDDLFHQLVSVFDRDTSTWLKQYDGNSAFPRLQFRPEESKETTIIYNHLSERIRTELKPIIAYAESVTGSKLYQNNPQLWRDPDGYINTIHDGDVSPNHYVNVQVYLCEGNENMGTYCYDQDNFTWHTVPFRPNCGYMMLHPTRTPHGMRYHVVDKRYSVYQGFRATEIPSDIW